MKYRNVLLFVGIGWLGLPISAPVFAMLDDTPPARPTAVASTENPGREPRQPQVAIDGDGRIFVAFGIGNTVQCARSADSGRTFSTATVGSVESLSLGMRRGPRVAVTEKAIVVSAIGGREGKGRDGDLLTWRSIDGGETWTGPVRVNTVASSAREGLHGMAAGSDGAVYCVWLDLRARQTEVYGARSKDGGETWEPDRLVYRSPGGSVCECCHPSVAYGSGGELAVMWRNQVQGVRDLYLARSADGGITFGPAEKLGEGTWPLTACPMDGGSIGIGRENSIETVWMRQGVIFAVRPGERERRLGRGVQGWTAVGPDGAYAVWVDARPGRLRAQIPNRHDPLILADSANDPVVAAGPGGQGPVVAVWEDRSTGGIAALLLDRAGPKPSD